MNSVFDNNQPEVVEIRERYKKIKLKIFFDKNKKNYDDTTMFLVVSMMNDDLENRIPFMFNSGIISLLLS